VALVGFAYASAAREERPSSLLGERLRLIDGITGATGLSGEALTESTTGFPELDTTRGCA
jgi:hypothetical protein